MSKRADVLVIYQGMVYDSQKSKIHFLLSDVKKYYIFWR